MMIHMSQTCARVDWCYFISELKNTGQDANSGETNKGNLRHAKFKDFMKFSNV